jgi:hypothetical protein
VLDTGASMLYMVIWAIRFPVVLHRSLSGHSSQGSMTLREQRMVLAVNVGPARWTGRTVCVSSDGGESKHYQPLFQETLISSIRILSSLPAQIVLSITSFPVQDWSGFSNNSTDFKTATLFFYFKIFLYFFVFTSMITSTDNSGCFY